MMNKKYYQREEEYALDSNQKCFKTQYWLEKNEYNKYKFVPQPTGLNSKT